MESLTSITGLGAGALFFCLFWTLVAGTCRGFAGFGLSAIVVTSLTLVLPPIEVVPIALLLETFSSIVMARMTWKDIRWRLLGWLMVGAAFATPLGVMILKFVAGDLIRAGISLAVLLACILLVKSSALTLRTTWPNVLSIGFVSGLANGAASLGGLPVAIFMLAAALPAAAVRATLNLYFLVLDIYGTGTLFVGGLLNQEVLTRTAVF